MLIVSTDSHIVSPLFFPGGDIGRLAVCGTVNDISMSGATPLYLTAGFILEEGLPISMLEKILASMKIAANEAGIQVVAGANTSASLSAALLQRPFRLISVSLRLQTFPWLLAIPC